MHQSHRFWTAGIMCLLLAAMLVVRAPSVQAADCTVTFRLDSNVTLAGMMVSVDYSDAGGDWPLVDLIYASACEPLDNWITLGNADDFSKTFTLVYQSSSPTLLDGPAEFAACAYTRAGPAPSASEFQVDVTQAFAPGGIPVAPLPQVSISDITCEGGGTTTTSTTQTTFQTTTTTLGAGGECGDPVDPPALRGGALSALVNATDALFALRAAVGLELCELCVCDLDDSGSVAATDALALLLAAVGQPGNLNCPPCS